MNIYIDTYWFISQHNEKLHYKCWKAKFAFKENICTLFIDISIYYLLIIFNILPDNNASENTNIYIIILI